MSGFVSKLITLAFLVLLFGIFATATSPSVFAHQSEDKNAVIIHMTEKGYEPSSITITTGTTVVFENVGASDQWPASDHHPSHTQYSGTTLEEHCQPNAQPSFDACKPVKVGESYSFRFDKEGAFAFHDHLWPHLDGEVIVKPPLDTEVNQVAQMQDDSKQTFPQRFSSFFRKTFDAIKNIFNKQDAQGKSLGLNSSGAHTTLHEESKVHYEEIVQEKDPREAIRALQESSAQDEKVAAICHDILHEIGHAAYKKYGGFKEAVPYSSDFCNSGYIHGLFEAYFESEPESLNELATLCDEYASGKEFDLWQCHHGIGHGFMYLTGGDLDESLRLCKINLENKAANDCQNGVYMEVFNSEILAKEKDFIDLNNPFATCSNRMEAKGSCYLYVPTYLSQTRAMPFEAMFEECQKSELGYKTICSSGIGSEAIKRNMHNAETVFDLCKQATEGGTKEACVRGVASMYLNQKGSYESGKEVCDKAPKEFEVLCVAEVKRSEAFFK